MKNARYNHFSSPPQLYLLFGLAAVIVLLFTASCRMAPVASTELPRIISRLEWNATEPLTAGGLYKAKENPAGWLVYQQPLDDILKTVIIHHSGLPLSDGPMQIQYKHTHERGFADIGYHFLIDQDGQIFEGRSISVRGAHTTGHNTGTIGVVLLGNFEEVEPTKEQWRSTKALLRYLAVKYRLTHLAGHIDFQPERTVCPGKKLEVKLSRLAADVGLIFGTTGHAGLVKP